MDLLNAARDPVFELFLFLPVPVDHRNSREELLVQLQEDVVSGVRVTDDPTDLFASRDRVAFCIHPDRELDRALIPWTVVQNELATAAREPTPDVAFDFGPRAVEQ